MTKRGRLKSKSTFKSNFIKTGLRNKQPRSKTRRGKRRKE